MKFYELQDVEQGKNLKKFNDDINKEVKKQQKPKTKPNEVFEGFTKKNVKHRMKGGLRFNRMSSEGGYY